MNRLTVLVGLVALGLLVALPWLAPFFYLFLATQILVLGLLAASYNLIFGYTGMLSFGHAAFYAVGAYATAMLLQSWQWPLLACLVVSFVVGMALALVIGFFCVRLDEVYFAMLTLAFGMMVYGIIHQWRSVTNGSDGISGFTVQSLGFGLDLNLANPAVYYHVVLVIVVLAGFALYRIGGSSFGLVLRAIRQNPERVSFCGLDVRRYRLAAFTVAGGFAGLAGGLMAPFLRIASPEMAHWTMSAEPVLMTILGGGGTFLGPFLGAALFVLLENWITSLTQAWMLFLGIILAVMVMFFRKGVLGTLLDWVQLRAQKR
ncbi:branched-chain amino acid ABC transporter permease [Castellaniella caeni]|uniref:branched-chain amino acid ABC transporter permease n=1 Tax=Castellaniella caeni TaxID=266123 RepID=UPI000832FFDE|nr:branched-chain amino acid ABC transporter permease [Castellaniella caeni]